jgi:hypothetical protein
MIARQKGRGPRIRIWLAAAALAAVSACSAARPEDVTARYARDGAPSLVVRAAANGDARVEAGETVFLRRGDADYVVLSDAAGRFSARIDDALAVFAADKTAIVPGPRAQPDYALSEGAAETVAGVKGRLWRGHPKEVPSLASFEGVVSTDPALAPLGRALAMQTRFAITRNSAIGGGVGKFEQAMLDLFAKGTVLRLNQALRLERIEKAPLDATLFDVPPPVLDRAALAARLARSP